MRQRRADDENADGVRGEGYPRRGPNLAAVVAAAAAGDLGSLPPLGTNAPDLSSIVSATSSAAPRPSPRGVDARALVVRGGDPRVHVGTRHLQVRLRSLILERSCDPCTKNTMCSP